MNLRQSIVDAILARFATIAIASGYQTNLGANVKEWQTTALDETDVASGALLVRDPVDTKREDPLGEASSRRTWELQIIVDAVLQESAQNAVQGRKAISDIKKAVAVDQTWGALAKRSEEVSDKLMLDKADGHVAGVQVIFNVITSRKPWDN
jgi:hypothetical protein